MPIPKAKAGERIDKILTTAGWQVQNCPDLNLDTFHSIVCHEFQLSTGTDYSVLFVNQRAVGTIKAKNQSFILSGIEFGSAETLVGTTSNHPAFCNPGIAIPLNFESTGLGTYLTKVPNPQLKSRWATVSQKPTTLNSWVQEPTSLETTFKTFYRITLQIFWRPRLKPLPIWKSPRPRTVVFLLNN